MAEQSGQPDYIFELGANAGPLIEELARVNRALSQAGQNANIAAPLEAAQQQARLLSQQISAATINLQRMEDAAAGAGREFGRNQSQVRNLEQTLRQIRQFQFISPEQIRNVQELERAYQRILSSRAPIDQNVFSQLVTNAQRLKAELKEVEVQTRQLEALGKQLRAFGTGRVGVDPGISAQVNQLRDSIAATGPIATSTFANIIRGLRATKDNYAEVTRQIELNIQAQRQQAAATATQAREQQKLNAVYRESVGSIQAAEAAFTRGNIKAINDTTRLLALQERLRTLRQTPEVQSLSGRVATAIQDIGDPQKARNMGVALAQLNQEYAGLARTAKASDSVLDGMFSSFGRRIQLVATLTLAYGSLRAAMSGVQFIVDIDREMTRMATAMANAGEKAEQLPGLFNNMQTVMRLTGMSANDAGKLVFELQKAMGDSAGTIEDALIPALSLVVVGEANQTEALRSLVGIYNVFGDTLTSAGTASEKYAKIADTLAIVSRNTTATAAGLTEAIQFSGARARLAGVEFDELTVFLGLLQNALQASGRSGTGLARTFEALINNMGAVQKAFDLDFGPDANFLDVMSALLAKLQAEIAQFSRLTPETLRKVEEAFKLEQAGRNVEVLALQISQFPGLLAKVRSEAGASKQVVEEFGTSISAAASSLLNEYLLALDKVLARMGGDEATGRFETLSRHFRQLQEDVEKTSAEISKIGFWDAFLNAATRDMERFGAARAKAWGISSPPPDSFGRQWPYTGRVPDRREPQLSQEHMDRMAEAARLMEKEAKDSAALEVTERGVAKAKDLIAKAQSEVNDEYQRMNPLLDVHQRLAFAIKDVGTEEKRLKELLADAGKNWQLLGDTQEKAAEKIAAQDRKLSQARLAADRLQNEIQQNAIAAQKEALRRAEEMITAEERISEAVEKTVTKLAKEKDLLLAGDNDVTAARAAVRGKLVDRLLAIPEGAEPEIKRFLENLVTELEHLEVGQAYKKIYEGLTKPFEDASVTDIKAITKLTQDVNNALRDMVTVQDVAVGGGAFKDLSEEAAVAFGEIIAGADKVTSALTFAQRTTLAQAPVRAVDKLIGLDKAEADLRSITAELEKFGEDATNATFAASRGFKSFSDLVFEADQQLLFMGERTLLLVIDRFNKLKGVTTDTNIANVTRDLELAGRALEVAFEIGGDPARIAANAAAFRLEKTSLDELANSANAARRDLAALLLQQAQQAITVSNVDVLNKQLKDLTNSNAGAAASFGQVGAAAIATQTAFQLEGRSLDQLDSRMQDLIKRVAEAIQKQKELADTGGLIAIGFSKDTASKMAQALALQDELNKKVDQGTEALSRWNQRGEVAFQRQIELSKQLAMSNNDIMGFLDAAFIQAATKGHSFFEDLDTLAKSTASSMSSSMSDFFFNAITGQLKDAQSAFKSFFLSIARELSNLLASQAVKAFVKIFFGGGSNQPITLGNGSQSGTGSGDIIINEPNMTIDAQNFGSTRGAAAQTGLNLNLYQSGLRLLSGANSLVGGFDAVVEALTFATVEFSNTGSIIGAIQSGLGTFAGGEAAALGGLGSATGAFSGVLAAAAIALNLWTGALQLGSEDIRTFATGAATYAGTVGGAVAGAIIGTIVPVIGNILGALIGGALGGAVGGAAGGIGLFDADSQGKALARVITGELNLQATFGKTGGVVAGGILGPVAMGPDFFKGIGLGGVGGDILGTLVNPASLVTRVLGALFEAFGLTPGVYGPKRATATQDANDALFGLTRQYGNAGRQPSFSALQAALGGISTVGTASLRTDLALTPAQASKLGIPGDPQGGPGPDATRIVKQWADLTTEQFERLIKAFRNDPELAGDIIRGSVTVPYLKQDLNDQASATAKASAESIIKLFVAFESIREKAEEVAAEIYKVAVAFLPKDLADAFLKNTINPIKEKISDVLASDMGIEAMTAELTRLEQTLRAYVALVALYGQASADLATLTGDFVEKQRQAVALISRQRDVNNIAVNKAADDLGLTPDLIRQIDTGVITPELEDILKTAVQDMKLSPELMAEKIAALLKAVKDRYEFEKNLILGVEGDIGKLYATHGKALEDLGQVLTRLQINATGSSTWLQGLYDGLTRLASTSLSVAERLAASTALLRNVLNALPALIAGQGGLDDPGPYTANGPGIGVGQILPVVMAGLTPFITNISDLIGTAVASGDWEAVFNLLEQGSAAVVDAMNQAIGGVRQWESMQIAAVNKTADEYIKGIEDVRDAQLDALKAQKDAIQAQIDVIDLQMEAIRDQKTALNDQRDVIQDEVDLIQEWADAVQGLRDFLLDLALSDAAPPDAVGQFQLAQTNFDQLFSSFMANPEAADLGGLQTAASQLINALGGIFEQPSSDYADVFNEILAQLESAEALAETHGGDPARLDDLLDQLKAIDVQLKALDRQEEILQRQEDVLRRELDKISKEEEKANKLAQDQIDEINDLRKQEISRIEAAADEQVRIIRDTFLPLIQAAASAQTSLFAFMRDNNYNLLLQLTSGQGTAAWMKTAMENTAAWIYGIGLLIHGFLTGDMKTIVKAITAPATTEERLLTTLGSLDTSIQTLNGYLLAAGATPVNVQVNIGGGGDGPGGGSGGDGGGAGSGGGTGGDGAVGLRYVNTGQYNLHEGEMVVPRAQSEMLRSVTAGWHDFEQLGSRGGDSISIGAIHINAPHATNAKAIADEMPAALERAIRSRGGVREAIRRVR